MTPDDEDTLGYGKPPAWGRFQSGVSGNPKGRPRKQKPDAKPSPIGPSDQDDSFREQLKEPVTITTRGGQKKISRVEAIQMAQQKAALQGNTHAQRDVLRAARELEERDRLREQQEQLERRESFLRVRDFRNERARQWAEAELQGTEPAEPWPHPDDIILDDGNDRWRLRGPLDERDVPFYRHIRAERDWHFSSMILGSRRARSSDVSPLRFTASGPVTM